MTASYSKKQEVVKNHVDNDDIKSIAKEYAERVWNKKDSTAILDYFDDSTVIHSLLGDFHGTKAMEEVVRAWLTGFPDLRVDNKLVIAENDLVSIQGEAKGTHRGEFKGRQPTGKIVSYSGVTIYRMRAGKIIEYWAYLDLQHLLAQIE